MDADGMMDYLSREYGIRSREELDVAVSGMPGVDLGIFTVPFGGSRGSARKNAMRNIAMIEVTANEPNSRTPVRAYA